MDSYEALSDWDETYVDDNRVESNDIHGMLVVAVDNIAGQRCVSDLQTSSICSLN